VLLTRLTARVVIMINALSWSGKDHRSDLLSCKTKDYKIGICSFFFYPIDVVSSNLDQAGRGVQHYVIEFVSDLRQVSGFLQVLWFPPPIKLTAMI
jgi:hypothetical protein